jgi:hypothetical protein
MLNKFFLIMAILLFQSCFEARDRRSRKLNKNSIGFDNSTSSGASSSSPSSSSNNFSNTNVYIPSGSENCQFSNDGITNFVSFSAHLGNYNICQSDKDDKKIFLQLKEPVSDTRICIIPTYHKTGSNLSIYLGEPRCIFVSDKSKIYQVDLVKNRQSPNQAMVFSHYAVKGIMIIKDKSFFYPPPFGKEIRSPDAFLQCSRSLDVGVATFCESFKSVGEYTSVKFSY